MKVRLYGYLLALFACAIPQVARAQEQLPEDYFSPSLPPAVLKLSPPLGEGFPQFLSVPSDEGRARVERLAEEPVASDPGSPDLMGTERIDGAEAESAGEIKPAPFPFGYNLPRSQLNWLFRQGDDFGMFSLESTPGLSQGEKSGLVASAGFHFLSGPSRTDMPPRMFDFQIGWQQRKWRSDTFGYDLSVRVGAFSDFEGSARKGIRFPGHAVTYYRWNPELDLVLGIESFDRDNITLLPVVGMIVTPRDDVRLELVFPRPRMEVRMDSTHSIYLSGELGGGTWAIERMSGSDDVVTYRDLRLVLGLATLDDDGSSSGMEIGYVFARDLSYRSSFGDYQPGDTLMFRLTTRY